MACNGAALEAAVADEAEALRIRQHALYRLLNGRRGWSGRVITRSRAFIPALAGVLLMGGGAVGKLMGKHAHSGTSRLAA